MRLYLCQHCHERQQPPGSLLTGALVCPLLGLVDPRLVALAPGGGDRDPGLLGQRRDEPADGALLPACGVHDLLQCGAAGPRIAVRGLVL